MEDLNLKALYKILNFELISFIEQAEKIKQKDLEEKENGKEEINVKEPGE